MRLQNTPVFFASMPSRPITVRPCFGASGLPKTEKTALDIPIKSPQGVTLPEFDRRLVREASENAFSTWLPHLKQALVQNNCHVLTCNHLPESANRLEDFFYPDELEAGLDKARQGLKKMQQEVKETLKNAPESEKGLITDMLAQLSQLNDDVLKQQLLEVMTLRIEMEGAMFIKNQNALALALPILKNCVPTLDQELLARVIRHEAGHFVDYVIGRKTTGKAFSDDETLRRLISDDIRLARQNGLLPDADQKTALGPPVGYYLPVEAESDNDFEAVAEIIAAINGGGVLDARIVRSLLPNAYRHVENLLKNVNPGARCPN